MVKPPKYYYKWLILYLLLQVFIKSELKVGVIYVKENQYTEEEILANNETSPLFEEFLSIMGEKVRLKGMYLFPISNYIYSGGPPLTQFLLPQFPLLQFLAYVHASGGFLR